MKARIVLHGTALLLGFLLQAPGWAADVAVKVAPGIQGKLSVPEGAAPASAVLLLHGFNGHMDEVGDLYKDLAGELASRGIASLRFDFSGEGQRVNYVVTSTIDSRLKETAAAYKMLREKFPGSSYGVVGFSLGGLTAMATLAAHPAWFKSMVLWSAAEEMGIPDDPGYQAAVKKAMREGRATYTDWTDITITREFLSSFVGVRVSGNLAKFEGSLLTIRGTRDFLPASDPAWLEQSPSNDKVFMLIGGADHIYNVLEDPRPDYGDKVIEATATWLARTL